MTHIRCLYVGRVRCFCATLFVRCATTSALASEMSRVGSTLISSNHSVLQTRSAPISLRTHGLLPKWSNVNDGSKSICKTNRLSCAQVPPSLYRSCTWRTHPNRSINSDTNCVDIFRAVPDSSRLVCNRAISCSHLARSFFKRSSSLPSSLSSISRILL